MPIKRYILAPDSFKGALNAAGVCAALKKGIVSADPDAEVICLPIADGGEGTVDAVGARRMPAVVAGPDGEPVEAFWGLMPDGGAVIEMAAAAGLPLSKLHNPEKTTTYGVGELIRAALDYGCRRFTVGLGGSATNDAGCGMAAALGAVFTDGAGEVLVPTGGTLEKIAHVSLEKLDSRLADCSFTTICDITNPLLGPTGAAYVFAPQKGADASMVERLDDGLRRFAMVVTRDTGVKVASLSGAGAAGGMGAGMKAFLHSSLESGIKVVLDLADFDRLLIPGSLVITGEGRFDAQSVDGKAVSGVAARAKARGVPVVVAAGSCDTCDTASGLDALGITALLSIQRAPTTLENALARTAEDLTALGYSIARLARALA